MVTNSSGMSSGMNPSATSDTDRSQSEKGLRDQSRRVINDVKELGSMASESVGEGAHRLKERGREMLDEGKEKFEQYRGQLKEYVGENPMKALLIAVGVGALLGLTLRRR